MNLHAIAGPIVSAVNPWQAAQWKASTGYTKDASYKQMPSYAAPVDVMVQMQALTFKDLQQVAGINLNGEARAMYLNGNVQGVLRPDGQGGDLFILPDASVWLVVHILEPWNRTAGWIKCAVVRQTAT